MVNNEVKNLIERLRDWYNTSDECNRKDMIQAADMLERIYSQPDLEGEMILIDRRVRLTRVKYVVCFWLWLMLGYVIGAIK